MDLQFFGDGPSGRGGGGSRGGGGRATSGAANSTDFTTLSDEQISDIIDNAFTNAFPSSLHDDITQRLIYAANWNGLPTVVSDAEMTRLLNSEDAIKLWRTVNDTNGGLNGLSMTSQQVADDFRTNPVFSTGGWGGQLYGGGVYFANTLAGSKEYGRGPNDSTTIGAVLNNRARVIDISELGGSKGVHWLEQHPQAARALSLSIDTSPWAPR